MDEEYNYVSKYTCSIKQEIEKIPQVALLSKWDLGNECINLGKIWSAIIHIPCFLLLSTP